MIDETVDEIREMQTHSSSIVAIKAAHALATLTGREVATVEEYVRDLERNSSALRQANPSHATLHTTQRQIVEQVVEADATSVADAKTATEAAVATVVSEVENAKHEAAANAAATIEDGMTILTHDYSSTLLEAIEFADQEGKHVSVRVTEARPRYLGRKTARRLATMGRIDTTMYIDSACGYALQDADAVMLGMDCIVGDTYYNRIGTFPICATAAVLDVPITVVGASSKVIEDGFIFENEYRSPSEVMREPAEGFSIENPAYEAVPMTLVDDVITD